MARMTYRVQDRHGTYYFRRIVPKALRPFMPAPWTGKSAWTKSLGTKEQGKAKQPFARCLSDCEADFALAERAMRGEPIAAPRSSPALPSDAEIEAEVLAGLLAADELERLELDPRQQFQTPEERAQWPDLVKLKPRGMAEDYHDVLGGELEAQHAAYRKALGRVDPEIVDGECRAFLRKHGLAIDPTSDAYHAVGLVILKAHVRAYCLLLQRHEGEPVETPAPPVPAAASKGPKLSEAFEVWKAGSGARGGKKPSDRTLLEASYAVRRLTEWHGDIRLGDLTRELARDFRDALETVPTRLPDKLKRLPMRELLAKDLKAYPPVHAATVNKALTILAAIISHAEAAGRLDAVPGFRNPFGKGMKLGINERGEERRQEFSTGDLKAIFGTGVFLNGERPKGGGGEAAFWLPLLALLSGARQGELAQLRVADVAKDAETGVWHLDIGTAGGRTIKTASSRRKVPLHPALEAAGLLRYRQSLLDAGAGLESPLWPGVEADSEGRRAGPWSKWFNRYLRNKAGVEDPAKVFHSFRHTFKRMARDAGLHEEMHDALTGHAGGGGVGRGYGRGFGLKAMAAEMAKIEAPEVVRGLSWP